MKMLKVLLVLMLAGCLLFAITGCGEESAADPDASEVKVLKVRTIADIKNMDPAFRFSEHDDVVASAIFNGLVTYGPDSYEVINDLAEELVFSEDGTEIYFKLHEGVMFHHGHGEVTAEDVKYSYERIIDPEVGSVYRDDWNALERVDIISTYEGTIVLKEAFAPLMSTTMPLMSGAIVPKDYVEEVGLDRFATEIVGSGPYYLDSWEPDQRIVIKRNEDYFGEAPYWDVIEMLVITDDQSAEIAIRTGAIDFGEVSPLSASLFEGDSAVALSATPNLRYAWVGFNVENPKLADVNLRKAIIHAVDVSSILEAAYDGQFERMTGLVAPGMLGHWADAPVYEQNFDKAREYMAAAGLDSLDLKMDILDSAEYRAWAEIMQENLKEIGINLQINSMEAGTFWEIGIGDTGKDVELFAMSYQMQPDPSWATMWFTTDQIGEWNWMRWGNSEFDELHKQGTATLDLDERQMIYERMQQLMDEDAVAIWITHGYTFFAYNPEVVSPALSPHGQRIYRFFEGN